MNVPVFRLRSKTRWIILALVAALAAYLLFFAPVRTYFDQRSQMQATEERYEMLAKTNSELEKRATDLQSDAEIARIAGERYELVYPGQKAYAVMPPEAPPTEPQEPKKNESLWEKITPWG